MSLGPFRDRVKHAVGTGGSGTLTLGAASSGFQAFQAGDDGLIFPYTIEDGTAWETGYGTYTHSGTSFARTTRIASSTGSALTVSASAFVFADAISDQLQVYENLMRLDAVPLSVTGATTLTIGKWHTCSGTAYTAGLPAASGNAGKYIGVRITASGFVVLDGNASETIDGALTRPMFAGESAVLYCDGSNWFKKYGKAIPLACFLRLTADQSAIAPATETTIALDATDIDNSGAIANTANNRMIVPRTSNYDLTAFIMVDGGTSFTAPRWITSIQRDPNTGTYAILLQREIPAVSGSYSGASALGFAIPLTVNDKLQISLLHTGGTSQSPYGNSTGASTHLSLKEVPSW